MFKHIRIINWWFDFRKFSFWLIISSKKLRIAILHLLLRKRPKSKTISIDSWNHLIKVYQFHHNFFQFLLSGKSIFKDQYPLSPKHFLDWINKCLGESCLSKRGIKLLKHRFSLKTSGGNYFS